MTKPRVVFAGTPEFALASLQGIVDAGIEPVAVLTQPDRPAGRGKRFKASPVKAYALSRRLPVLQPTSLRDEEAAAELATLEPDLMIVAAYGLLLPQAVLDIPRCGCLNVHASLLPRWRGAAPVQAAILAGDQQTGISLMSMTAGLDCGPVYAARVVQIGQAETAGELRDRLAAAGSALLLEHLEAILDGRIEPVPQHDEAASYAPKIRTIDAQLDWQRPASELARMVRAYNPVPGAWFMLGEERIKCWLALAEGAAGGAAGTVTDAGADGVRVACGSGTLRLLELQRPGKNRVTAAQFAASLDICGRKL